MDFEFLVAMGSLARIEPSPELCEKEMEESEYDLQAARRCLSENDAKWSIIKSYYSMFHGAKGVLFLIGFREKTHRGVADALDVLCREGKLESGFANDFRAALGAREGADYSYKHPKETAESLLEMADEFCARMRKLAKTLDKKPK